MSISKKSIDEQYFMIIDYSFRKKDVVLGRRVMVLGRRIWF